MCKQQVVGKKSDGVLYLHPCGQCLNCRINDTRSWFVRSYFERKYSDRDYHYFLTLTYNDEELPDDKLCKKNHLKSFLNNLNTSFNLRLRYFATSDYGSINMRPHYHALLFSSKKITHKKIEQIWKKGFVKIKPITIENMKYVLRYTVKKTPFDGSLDGWFRLISLHWGEKFIEHYHGQEYILIDGKKYGIPDYYKEKLGIKEQGLDSSKYFDRLYLENKDVMDNYEKAYQDLKDQFFARKEFNIEQLS